jgi:V8-like Glu-specific endopeptidase
LTTEQATNPASYTPAALVDRNVKGEFRMRQKKHRLSLAAGIFSILLVSSILAPVLADNSIPTSDSIDIDSGLALSGVTHQFRSSDNVPFEEPDSIRSVEVNASFERIFQPDTRRRITPTTHYPASTIAFIEGGFSGGFNHCSGTFIGPNVVLTAAHCLYTPETGWSQSQLVVPGADGAAAPFGYQFAEWGWVPDNWIQTGDLYFDWGILVMPNSELGNRVGWMTMGLFSNETLASPSFNPGTVGYPGDKPLATMWMSIESAFLRIDNVFLYNRLDAYYGQSGSAVWRNSDGYIAGVLSFETSAYNVARRINEEVIASLLEACWQLNCSFDYYVEEAPAPQPPPTPTPEPTPTPDLPETDIPVFPSYPDAQRTVDNFGMTRDRTDFPVEAGQVNRTWMWGPGANSTAIVEQYIEAPGNVRVVQYFDKSRMEDNAHRASPPWHVTNGLLVVELITGRMQVGDNSYVDREPADVQVAGDDHPDSPTYAMLDPMRSWDPIPVGAPVIQRLNRDGSVTEDSSLAGRGVTGGHHVADTDHTVASVFWEFMNSSGTVYDQGTFRHDNLFENPFFATGFPITEAYWVHVPVGGNWQDVLLQCFERRCLTYTPENPSGWQVEAGNVGQHYYRWRYGDSPAHP